MGDFFNARTAVAVTGPVGTGKTAELVARLGKVLEAGAAPDEVLVLAAAPAAADALASRIVRELGDLACGVRVTTPLALAREIMATPEAHEAAHGRTHVLTGFEQDFFFEDMRVTGEKQRRLREMLKFLQRGWSEMREEEPGWLITNEERSMDAFARGRLAFLGALLPSEATAAAVRVLVADDALFGSLRRSWVFADDCQAMSRASQRLAGLLACEGLVTVWSETDGLRGEEPYGYAEGLDELAEAAGDAFECVALTESCQAAAPCAVVANLLAQDCLGEPAVPAAAGDAAQGSFEVLTAGELADEPAQAAACVAAALGHGIAPEDVYVCVPNDGWGRRVEAALDEAGAASSRLAERPALGGDIHERAKCTDAVAYTALHLAADPESALAWRCWVGFGDYLTCSAGISALADRAQEGAGSLPEQLRALARGEAGEVAVDTGRLVEALRAGEALLARVDGLRGPALLEALCEGTLGTADVPAGLAALLGPVGQDETAGQLYTRAAEKFAAPRFVAGAVRVGGIDALLGQAPRTVVFAGMANGLVPPSAYFDLSQTTIEAQDKMHRRLLVRLAAAAGKAREVIACSTFARAGLVESEKLHLKTERIRLRQGRRVCETGPSVAIQYMTGEKTSLER